MSLLHREKPGNGRKQKHKQTNNSNKPKKEASAEVTLPHKYIGNCLENKETKITGLIQ